MKPAWLWVIDQGEAPVYVTMTDHEKKVAYQRHIMAADLLFSSPEKFEELLGRDWKKEKRYQLVEIEVPDSFQNWDFIPDNY